MSIQLVRYTEILKRLTESKGGEPLSDLNRELSAVLVLENDRAEWAALGGTRLIAGEFIFNASAANLNQMVIQSPDTNTITVITGVISYVHTVKLGLQSVTGFVKSDIVRFRDNRLKGKPSTGAFTKQTAASVFGTAVLELPINILVPTLFVLAGGPNTLGGLVIESEAVNQTDSVAFVGYERQAETDENDNTAV